MPYPLPLERSGEAHESRVPARSAATDIQWLA